MKDAGLVVGFEGSLGYPQANKCEKEDVVLEETKRARRAGRGRGSLETVNSL